LFAVDSFGLKSTNMNKKSLPDQHKEHRAIPTGRDGLDHFQHQINQEKENPGGIDRLHKSALDWGQKQAEAFLDKVYDHTRTDHEQTFAAFRTQFNCSREEVEKYFKNEAVSLMNAPRLEFKNTAYENSVFANYRMANEQDMAFMAKFRDYMKTKWAAVGYTGDEEFVNEFWNLHPLSTKPRAANIQLA
jgi:hypothetical protein